MCSAMAANVFDDQILRHILSFVPGSSELAPKYSLQPETGHYLVKAGWPVVLKKMCHWKEADTTICICCGANQEPGDPNESDDSWTSQQVSAGWAKVMTVTIPHFRHHHMKYIKKNSQKHRICLEDNGSREMLHLRALQRLRCESRV